MITEEVIFFKSTVKILYFRSQFRRNRTVISLLDVIAGDELSYRDNQLEQRSDNIGFCLFFKISDSYNQRLALIVRGWRIENPQSIYLHAEIAAV